VTRKLNTFSQNLKLDDTLQKCIVGGM